MQSSPSGKPKNPPQQTNILLIDDQQAKLLSYEVMLAGIGDRLIKATSACEAFECLLKNEVALILIDVCMPDLDGFKLAALIREHPRFQRTGIIFVSAAMTTHLDQLRGYDLGAFDYITVPVHPELLRAKVRIFLDIHGKTRELERLNIELERRVAERTAALRQLNEDLEDRIEQRAREREKALAQLLEARKAESIGEFTGEAAHDFNNLLMAVLGSLSLLAKRLPADPHCRRLIDIALQGGRRGAALAQRLLAFSRRQELKPEPVNIGELVSGMQGLLKRAVGMSIELDCQLPGALAPVLVDANQLELVLLNVALNARDAMPAGGRLSISAGEVGDAEVEHSPLPPGGYMRIKLADTGVGMDEATRVKAVEPFFTTKHPSLGGGLGLSVAQGIAAQSGGLLCIESAPNSGTAVEVWLPQFEDALRPSKDLRVIAARMACQSGSNDVFPGN